MLNTKFVKFLQSRPYHVRMFIFIFTIATAGMVMISLWLSSLSNTFIAATNKSKMANNESVAVIAKNEKLPSLMNNMKASIKDATSTFSNLFEGSDNDNLNSDNDKQSVKKREIKPIRLPVDKQ